MPNIITVDGPAGVGKGTLCKMLSTSLNAKVLNSGEIYRSIAYNIYKLKINPKHTSKITSYIKNYKYEKVSSNKLYSKKIDLISSEISTISELRKKIIYIQHGLIYENNNPSSFIVAEGRDMGTKIFPKAQIKIFLWAKANVRAKRRYLQVIKVDKTRVYEDIFNEIILRDMSDMGRKIAPLCPAEDSYLIDNSNLDIEQCFNKILKIIKKYKKTINEPTNKP